MENKKELKAAAEMLFTLKDRVNGRINFVKNSALPENEINLQVHENEILLRVIDKVINNKLKPPETLETVRGTQYKIGDTFCINGNNETKYEILSFPDSVTVRGHSSNPNIGQAYTVEAYIEDIYKPKKQKVEEPKVVRLKKPQSVEIKVGEYFSIKSASTIYKVTRVKEQKVFGVGVNDKDIVGVYKTDIILKRKKDYKKQNKANNAK